MLNIQIIFIEQIFEIYLTVKKFDNSDYENKF